MTITEAAATGAVVGVALFGITMLWLLVRWVWRSLRRLSIDGAARTAGAITGRIQDRATRAADAFRAGRKRS